MIRIVVVIDSLNIRTIKSRNDILMDELKAALEIKIYKKKKKKCLNDEITLSRAAVA